MLATPKSTIWGARKNDIRRGGDCTGRYSVCGVDRHDPLCIISLDFTAAFDWISYTYLFRMLSFMTIALNSSHTYKQCTIEPSFRCKLMATMQDHFPYNVSLDNCLTSMLIFGLVLNSLISLFERHFTSIKNWTLDRENCGSGISRRCQDFYDGTSRH